MQALPPSADGVTGDSCDIYVTIADHYIRGIDNATVVFTVEGPGYVTDYLGVTNSTGMPLTTLVIPPDTEPGVTKVKAKVWMIDVEGEIDVSIYE
jgi:hypothetical protein